MSHGSYDSSNLLSVEQACGRAETRSPGVDSQWEMQLYGLVCLCEREQDIWFLREPRNMARKYPQREVVSVADVLGMA